MTTIHKGTQNMTVRDDAKLQNATLSNFPACILQPPLPNLPLYRVCASVITLAALTFLHFSSCERDRQQHLFETVVIRISTTQILRQFPSAHVYSFATTKNNGNVVYGELVHRTAEMTMQQKRSNALSYSTMTI